MAMCHPNFLRRIYFSANRIFPPNIIRFIWDIELNQLTSTFRKGCQLKWLWTMWGCSWETRNSGQTVSGLLESLEPVTPMYRGGSIVLPHEWNDWILKTPDHPTSSFPFTIYTRPTRNTSFLMEGINCSIYLRLIEGGGWLYCGHVCS